MNVTRNFAEITNRTLAECEAEVRRLSEILLSPHTAPPGSPEAREKTAAMFEEWALTVLVRVFGGDCVPAQKPYLIEKAATYASDRLIPAFWRLLDPRYPKEIRSAARRGMLVILRRSLSGDLQEGELSEGTGRAKDDSFLPEAVAAGWEEPSERRFRDLVRLEARGTISLAEQEELERLAGLRRKAVSPMPADEAVLEEQRLTALRKVLGALEDYARSFDTTDSSRPSA